MVKIKKKVLDLTSEKCPMTFLKAKEFLKANNNVLDKIILIKGAKDFKQLLGTLEKNFKVRSKKIKKSIYEIYIKN